jgi:hypothetical protein
MDKNKLKRAKEIEEEIGQLNGLFDQLYKQWPYYEGGVIRVGKRGASAVDYRVSVDTIFKISEVVQGKITQLKEDLKKL